MNYRRLGTTDVSEIALDCAAVRNMTGEDFGRVVAEAVGLGINFFCTLRPEETVAVGQALGSLSARRKAIVSAGIEDFFPAFTRHEMRLEEFLEHEIADRLERLGGNYLDCFVIDLGRGRAVDLQAVRAEPLTSGGNGKAIVLESYEGGTFLHETISECLEIIERFKNEGRVRISAVSGENIEAVKRVLVKHEDFDAVFVPYNYGFRAAAEELIPIAAELKTAVVATKPLWWSVREIPVTVLATSPYPPEKAAAGLTREVLARAACKWPLAEKSVACVVAEVAEPGDLAKLANASTDTPWTRSDEDTLRPTALIAQAEGALLLVLSAMNSDSVDLRARGWAALQGKGLAGEFEFDPGGPADERRRVLAEMASQLMAGTAPLPEEDLEELL